MWIISGLVFESYAGRGQFFIETVLNVTGHVVSLATAHSIRNAPTNFKTTPSGWTAPLRSTCLHDRSQKDPGDWTVHEQTTVKSVPGEMVASPLQGVEEPTQRPLPAWRGLEMAQPGCPAPSLRPHPLSCRTPHTCCPLYLEHLPSPFPLRTSIPFHTVK